MKDTLRTGLVLFLAAVPCLAAIYESETTVLAIDCSRVVGTQGTTAGQGTNWVIQPGTQGAEGATPSGTNCVKLSWVDSNNDGIMDPGGHVNASGEIRLTFPVAIADGLYQLQAMFFHYLIAIWNQEADTSGYAYMVRNVGTGTIVFLDADGRPLVTNNTGWLACYPKESDNAGEAGARWQSVGLVGSSVPDGLGAGQMGNHPKYMRTQDVQAGDLEVRFYEGDALHNYTIVGVDSFTLQKLFPCGTMVLVR
jgi:hypothetical protein